MKKYIKFVIIIALLLLIVTNLTYSYGIDENEQTEQLEKNNTQSFFEIESEQISKTETLEMVISIENITYDNFTFELSSNTNIKQVEIKETSQVDINKNNNEITIEFNKKESNLDKIILYLTIPDTVQIGDKITLTATITNNENNEEKQTAKKEITVIEEKNEDNTELDNDKKQENNSDENSNITNNETQENNNIQKDENNTKLQQTSNMELVKTQTESETKSIATEFKTNSTSSSTSSKSEVTYNGSDNNYLSELSVANYELNKEFSKENQTYFITVEENVESLEITTNTENTNAIVNIYGNEELQEGINKILITVTAENGNVRTYRIYVTKK